ncbi:DUF1489 family protein [Methylobacterium nonmethylotrophicum]|uniref:DUF1489 family protein n=1 Tax=Methylobacterium nonmethylotrophicum TaxID=1141884 RepID=A0A4Z0NWP8_9HYPH|nr:DUF1489 domain-containing protein [Methylobacterium nonmethylotrophicum]TGE01890.1 DUF1489 family protein [Methylobacterium nonmethylotrophicum]
MPLHLLKLCVGCESIADLEEWIAARRAESARQSRPHEQAHITRMVPKRGDEIVGAGSLYWVIRGLIACRQPVLAIRPFTDGEGVGRCRLVLDPEVTPVEPRPCRPFQGWRYLAASDAPRDISRNAAGDLAAMPESMRRELASLGLL